MCARRCSGAWAVELHAFGGLALGELLVNARAVGRAEGLVGGEGFGADAIVVVLVDHFSKGLRAVSPGKNAWKLGNEALLAREAMEAAGVSDALIEKRTMLSSSSSTPQLTAGACLA